MRVGWRVLAAVRNRDNGLSFDDETLTAKWILSGFGAHLRRTIAVEKMQSNGPIDCFVKSVQICPII
jgi:hypothetical protein